MSSGDLRRKHSLEEIRLAQQLMIKQCLNNHMTKEETKSHLAWAEHVDPDLTEYLWQDLGKKRPNWVKNYYARINEKRQISRNDDKPQSKHQEGECGNAQSAAMAAPQVTSATTSSASASAIMKKPATTSASTILKKTATSLSSSATSDSDSVDISEWFVVDSDPLEANKTIPLINISEMIVEDYFRLRDDDDDSSKTNINMPRRLADSPSHGKTPDKEKHDRLGKDGSSSKGFSKNG